MPQRVTVLIQRDNRFFQAPFHWVEEREAATAFNTYLEAMQIAKHLADLDIRLVVNFVEGGSLSLELRPDHLELVS